MLTRLLSLLFCSLVHAAEKPNVILIFTDDQGYQDLSCYGAKNIRTPRLDSLAAQGTRFTNFHVAQAVCSASRAALLTGCYPNRLGIHGALMPDAKNGLAASELTLAEMFRQLGYATGMAGKWHLGHLRPHLPIHHGFHEWLGLPYSNDMWPVPRGNESQPYGTPPFRNDYPELPLMEGDGKILTSPVTAQDQAQLTRKYTDRCLAFLQRHHDQPFFFYLAHSMPHVPLFASEPHRGKSRGGLYGDVIEEIDHNVGRILDELEKLQLTRNTLVIFTTDNGPWHSFGTHGGSAGTLREAKGTVWEGGIRVPCIMSWPGHIPANMTNHNYFMTIDLLPTLAALTDAKLPTHTIDGKNVWPLITNQPKAVSPHAAYWNYFSTNQLQAVTSGDGAWKLILPHSYRSLPAKTKAPDPGKSIPYITKTITDPELYHLAHDSSESQNVAAAHPDIVQRLLAEATEARAELGDSLTKTRGKGTRDSAK